MKASFCFAVFKASNFFLQYNINVVPQEFPVLEDTTAGQGTIKSDIDKSLGSSMRLDCETNTDYIKYKDYTTTSSYVAFNHASLFNDATGISMIFIKIREVAGSGTPDVTVSLDNGVTDNFKLSGLNDFCAIRNFDLWDPSTIKIKSTAVTGLAKLDIIRACEQ